MKLLLLFILGIVCNTIAVKIELDQENGLDNVQILENLFWNNKENISEYLDLSDYRANGTFKPQQYETENVTRLEEEAFSGIPGKINGHGYPVERHFVQTSDGYILQMHRIPSSPNSTVLIRRPVFLMHGLLDSSAAWVLMGPQNSLAYLLADLGYDVWMGNARGNRYSRSHTRWNPDGDRRNRRAFWNFSWNEIGMIDVPAMIDYVLANNTNFQRVHYIGHSQGTTAFWVMASARPEYNQKVLLMSALAPVSFLTHCRSPAGRAIARLLDNSQALIRVLGQYEFLPGNDILTSAAMVTCRQNSLFAFMCRNILFLFGGFNSELFDDSNFPVILRHTPAGSSAAQIIHYGQLMRTTRFQRFDHGAIRNLQIYGSIRPPIYQLERISAPVALHYGRNDLFADVRDVQRLSTQLPNLFGLFPVPHPRFNHFDFLWARNIRELLYNRVVVLMRSAEQNEIN